MKFVDPMIRICLFVLFLSVGLPITASDQARAADSIGRYVFEYCHNSYSSSGSLQTYDGFFIDDDGAVWSFDHGDYQWSPKGSDGLFYENDLYDKYRNVKQVGTVDKSVLSSMASLIVPASQGELSRNRRVAGMDSMSYGAYLYDPGQGAYKEILLSVRGSGAAQNASNVAKPLVTWLESVFFPNSKSNPPEPVRSGVQQPAAGTATPGVRVIQKVPAPKPEIKGVEIKGPFPVEDRSE